MAESGRPKDEGITARISREMLRRFLVSLSATAATAATAYLTRKAAKLWEEEAMPKIRERGGGEAVVKDAFAKASELFDTAATTVVETDAVTALKEKAEDVSLPLVSGGNEPEIQAGPSSSDADREAEREERRRRRSERQRRLQSSGST
jgi:hypothetical protein